MTKMNSVNMLKVDNHLNYVNMLKVDNHTFTASLGSSKECTEISYVVFSSMCSGYGFFHNSLNHVCPLTSTFNVLMHSSLTARKKL